MTDHSAVCVLVGPPVAEHLEEVAVREFDTADGSALANLPFGSPDTGHQAGAVRERILR